MIDDTEYHSDKRKILAEIYGIQKLSDYLKSPYNDHRILDVSQEIEERCMAILKVFQLREKLIDLEVEKMAKQYGQ